MDNSFTLFNETIGDARLSATLKQMRLATSKENAQLVFKTFDSDGDGKLKFHETKYAFKALGFDLPNHEVLEIIVKCDPEHRRFIQFRSFEREVIERTEKLDPSQEVKRAFKELSQGTDAITVQSLTQYTNSIDYPATEQEIRLLFETFDLNDDGKISFEEFLTTFDA